MRPYKPCHAAKKSDKRILDRVLQTATPQAGTTLSLTPNAIDIPEDQWSEPGCPCRAYRAWCHMQDRLGRYVGLENDLSHVRRREFIALQRSKLQACCSVRVWFWVRPHVTCCQFCRSRLVWVALVQLGPSAVDSILVLGRDTIHLACSSHQRSYV